MNSSRNASPAGLFLSIPDDEFKLFQELVRRHSGISLGPHKRPLLLSRLAPRLRALGLHSFAEYHRRVTGPGGQAELEQMLDCICTNETRFFREPRQFELIRRTLLPEWTSRLGQGGAASAAATVPATHRRLRVWSAACSTGEEPYSLAMTLLHGLAPLPPDPRHAIEILATDLSTRALDRAQRAIYPIERAPEIPHDYLFAYMLRGQRSHAGEMKAGPELRALVTFRRENLIQVTSQKLGRFDLVLCRNVLIYFDAATKALVLDRIVDCLNPGGYLFLGYAESLNGQVRGMANVAPSVYRREALRGGSTA
ncbi:CheR family methyltransferase [Polyangium jinanense]|uniref:CheR family methyltransferase n=1 Tax=Polyangium jinanense TaxID=2829994 RepID=UPI002341B2E6|nr:protein-glutamate O-methyltransferase CheR [Polyangium jinanense]